MADSPKDSSTPRIRRRNRMITSCLECRRRKLKCDKLHPCTNCSKFSRDCMFLAPALDSVSQKKLNELKDKMGSLEKVLENDIARKGSKRSSSPGEITSSGDLPGEESGSGSDREIAVPEDEKPLEYTKLAVTDAAYEDSASEDLLDLGVRLGRMRLAERFGGTFRPRFAEEIASALGEPINKDMNDPNVRRLSDHEDFLAPGPNFVAPGSGFVFGDIGARRNLIDFLPSKSAADTLLQKYYQNVYFIARTVHWPSFQLQYESFWNNVLSGYEPQASLQAVVFAVLFSAVASMEHGEVYALFGSGKETIMSNFQTATEVALGKANYLRATKLETLQALVIYMVPMVREELSRAHSVLLSSAIRLAECMGLHRDPDTFGMSPIVSHVRRMLWFQLCYLDFRTSEVQAPRQYIKRENYDTRFPLDINDVDLMSPEPQEPSGVWTDMTLSRLRFECCEMWRITAGDADRLRRKKISLTHTMGKIESFRRAMEAKYLPILDVNIPIQAYAKHFLTSAMSRMHVTVLHRYHHSVHVQLPDRLRDVLISNSVSAMEHFLASQQKSQFAELRWLSTSVTTFNPAMLLLLEVWINPDCKEADRIWPILDYTFMPDLSLDRRQRARQILSTIRDRIAFYRDIRQIREPVGMPSTGQMRTIPIRNSKNDAPGPGSVLLKKENSDQRHGSRVHSISPFSGSESVNGRASDLADPLTSANMRQVDTESWTFDSESTLFLNNNSNSTRGASPKSRGASASPSQPANACLPPQRSMAAMTVNGSGLDYGHSPGSSSTTTDTWPPQIVNDRQGWDLDTSPPLGLQNDRRVPAMSSIQPPVGQMASMYLPQTYPNSNLPFIANNHTGVEAMLQPATTGYAPEESMSLEIDWGEWDKIFPPPQVNAGHMDQAQVLAQ